MIRVKKSVKIKKKILGWKPFWQSSIGAALICNKVTSRRCEHKLCPETNLIRNIKDTRSLKAYNLYEEPHV